MSPLRFLIAWMYAMEVQAAEDAASTVTWI